MSRNENWLGNGNSRKKVFVEEIRGHTFGCNGIVT